MTFIMGKGMDGREKEGGEGRVEGRRKGEKEGERGGERGKQQ